MEMRKLLLGFLMTVLGLSLVSCATDSQPEQNPATKPTPPPVNETSSASYVNVLPISYQEVAVQKNMKTFWEETKTLEGPSHDGVLDYGFVNSVWHKLKVNGVEVAVYSTRCGFDVHSFAWVDIETDGKFSLDIELKVANEYEKVVVLPEEENVQAEIDGKDVRATINNYGSFSFAFDDKAYMAMTLYVAPKSKLEVPTGYDVVNIEPGRYDNVIPDDEEASVHNTLDFTRIANSSEKVYVFKSGVYDVTCINLPTNSVVYFEAGVYLRAFQTHVGDYNTLLGSSGDNVKVLGRAIVDFSQCIGGEAKTKGAYNFSGSNIYVEGLISINSNTWTMCFTAADNIEITRCMFFGYRTFSDGVMFSDCTNGYAHDNFVRTGDDAMEVKAFSTTSKQTNNIVFENNAVWTDKGIAYGCIYESVHDVENVYFRNNSVGFAQAAWSEHLGTCVIQMGSMKQSTWHDVYFENMEIYKTNCAAISVFNRAQNANEGGKIRDIYFKNITVKYAEQTNLPVYCINIVIRLTEGVDARNSTIGQLFIDKVNYCGVDIEKANYLDYTNIALSDGAIFSKSSIKLNTLE